MRVAEKNAVLGGPSKGRASLQLAGCDSALTQQQLLMGAALRPEEEGDVEMTVPTDRHHKDQEALPAQGSLLWGSTFSGGALGL